MKLSLKLLILQSIMCISADKMASAFTYKEVYVGDSVIPDALKPEGPHKCTLTYYKDYAREPFQITLEAYGSVWDKQTNKTTLEEVSLAFYDYDESFDIESNLDIQSSWAYPGYTRFAYINIVIPAKFSNKISFIVKDDEDESVIIAEENDYFMWYRKQRQKIVRCENLQKINPAKIALKKWLASKESEVK